MRREKVKASGRKNMDKSRGEEVKEEKRERGEGAAPEEDSGRPDNWWEVDGVSLVGVSSCYLATVLKNTSGLVNFQSKLRAEPPQLHHARGWLKALKEQQACWESQRAELEQRAEDGEEKADKLEKYWQEAQTLCRVVSQRLADAQSQSESLEIKYSKAKRLVREYQN
ncbi:neurabin-2-like protein, partial [Lates japonicus]